MNSAAENLPQPLASGFMLGVANWLVAQMAAGRNRGNWSKSENLLGDRGVRQIAYEMDVGDAVLRLVVADTRATDGESKPRLGLQLLDGEGVVVDSVWSGGFRRDSEKSATKVTLEALRGSVEASLARRQQGVQAALIEALRIL